MADLTLNVGFGTPFQAQIDFLLQKLRLPTERWDDIRRAAHDRAVVAGAAKADLLTDLHQAGGGQRTALMATELKTPARFQGHCGQARLDWMDW